MDEIPASVLTVLQRLDAAGFSLVPASEIATHYLIARGELVSLVERRPDGAFGSSGNPGKLTAGGLALFVRRGDQAFFIAKGVEVRATEAEAMEAEQFARDLATALRPAPES